MKETFVHFAEAHLYLHIILITLCTAAILVAMAIDLVAGVAKAKENGIATTSRGLKLTSKKAVRYLVPFVILTLLDMVASFVLPAPFFSMLWAAYVLYCEFKSVREKSWEKKEIHDFERTIKIAASDKADIAKLLADLMGGAKDAPTPTTEDEPTASPPPMTEADIVKLVTDIMRKANEAQEAPEADNATA